MALSRECSFHLLMKSSTAPSPTAARTKTLTLDCYPQSTMDIKKEIQKEFQIPTFAQTVQYEQITLSDSSSPRSVHIRNGDTLQITYESAAECIEIDEVVAWLNQLDNLFKVHLPCSSDETPTEGEVLLDAINPEKLMDLFIPWHLKLKHMNRRYFLHAGGVDLLLKVYSVLVKQEWQDCTQKLKSFELTCLKALSEMMSTVLINRGCIEPCLQSLLRAKLRRRERGVEGIEAPDILLMEVIFSAMGTLLNMSEVPEGPCRICSSPEVLEQFLCIAQSPSYTCWSAQNSICLFACLAHDAAIHPYLASADIISGVIDACSLHRDLGSEPMDVLLMEYFTLLFLAQLILISPQLISIPLYAKLSQHMSEFLSSITNPSTIAKQEYENGFHWVVFLPYVKLLYVPSPRLNSSGNLADPLDSSTRTVGTANEISRSSGLSVSAHTCTDDQLNPHLKCAECGNTGVSMESSLSPLPLGNTSVREVPPDSSIATVTLSNLLQLSTETTIFSLQVIFSNESGRKGLLKNRVFCDYIQCLPSYLSGSLREKAKGLVSLLGAHVQLQPPRLSLLAKARLAKMHFGLERMLQVHSMHELYAELYS